MKIFSLLFTRLLVALTAALIEEQAWCEGTTPQTITWQGNTSAILALNTAHPLSARASSGLPVTLRVDGGPGAFANGMITVTELGTVVVTAEQAGNATYAAARLTRSFNLREAVLSPVGVYETGVTHRINSVHVVGNYAYMTTDMGLQVIDVSNPANPVRVGGYDTADGTYDVRVVGNYAYLGNGAAGLLVIDVTDPANPVRVGRYDTLDYAIGVQVFENYAYVADRGAGLQVIDVSNPAQPVLVGHEMSGPAISVEVVGHYAYVTSGGVQVIDVSNPTQPVRMGGYNTKGVAYGVQVLGNYAYLAAHNAGLEVIDVSNLANPVRVSSYVDTNGAVVSVQVTGSYAFVRDAWNHDFPPPTSVDAGLQVIDISNPAGPVGVGRYDISSNGDRALQVVGNYAYLATRTGLLILRLRLEYDHVWQKITWHGTTDAFLTLDADYPLGATVSSGLPVTVRVDSGPAVMANGTIRVTGGGTVVVSAEQAGDVTYLPARVTRSFNVPQAQTLTWQGTANSILTLNTAYPLDATASSGLPVTLQVDSGPAVMANGTIRVTGVGTVVVSAKQSGDELYAATRLIRRFNVRTQVQFTLLDFLPVNGGANSVQAVGNYAYVADAGIPLVRNEGGGLQVFDVSNLVRTRKVGGVERFDFGTAAHDVHVVGNYAYVADESGLQVLDVSVPAIPVRMGGYETSGSANRVEVAGDLAYVADGDAGLLVIDLSNPTKPVRVGGYDTSGSALGVEVVGNYAYVADGSAGLQVIDVGDPAGPVRVGGYATSGSARNLRVVENYAYVADDGAGLQVIDVSVPTSPMRVGGVDPYPFSNALDVRVEGNYAYVAEGSSGLQVIDVSDPTHPLPLGRYNNFQAKTIDVVDNLAYLAGGDGANQFFRDGVQILELRFGDSQEVTWQGTTEKFLTLNVDYPLGATASSGLPVTLRVDSGPAVLANGAITATGLGTVVVSAEQEGDAFYLPVSALWTVSVIPRRLSARLAEGQVELFWASGFDGLRLQGRETLSPDSHWQDVTTPPVEGDGETRVLLESSSLHRYFRLLKP